MQQFQPLWSHFGIEVGDAREIAARMIEACDKADFNRIQADHENYRDVTRCRFGRQRHRAAACNEHGYAAVNQLHCQIRQSLVFVIRPAVFDSDIAIFGVAGLAEALFEPKERTAG